MWLGQEEKHDGHVLSPKRRSKASLKTLRQEKIFLKKSISPKKSILGSK